MLNKEKTTTGGPTDSKDSESEREGERERGRGKGEREKERGREEKKGKAGVRGCKRFARFLSRRHALVSPPARTRARKTQTQHTVQLPSTTRMGICAIT